jgi:hypothetical protein
MNRIILTIIFLVIHTSVAFADNFQIRALSARGSSVFAAYSTVMVFDRNNKLVLTGNTDAYGRIIININTGTYWLELSFRGKTCRKSITINKSRQFKYINFVSSECR